MSQQLRALIATTEDPGLIPRTHIEANNCLYSSSKGSYVLFCLSLALRVCGT